MSAQTACRLRSSQLARIAASTSLDEFAKVKAEIDKLAVEWEQQQKDEIVRRYECTEEMNTNTRLSSAADARTTALQTKIAERNFGRFAQVMRPYQSSIKTLTKDIEIATTALPRCKCK